LVGGNEGVGVEETADFGVVIAALQVIKLGFLVVDIAAVAQGVMVTYDVGLPGVGGHIAPGIVDIAADYAACVVQNGDHIALNVGDVEVGFALAGHRQGRAVSAVGKVQGIGGQCTAAGFQYRQLGPLCHPEGSEAESRDLALIAALGEPLRSLHSRCSVGMTEEICGLPVFPSSGTAKAAPPSPRGRRPYELPFSWLRGRIPPPFLVVHRLVKTENRSLSFINS